MWGQFFWSNLTNQKWNVLITIQHNQEYQQHLCSLQVNIQNVLQNKWFRASLRITSFVLHQIPLVVVVMFAVHWRHLDLRSKDESKSLSMVSTEPPWFNPDFGSDGDGRMRDSAEMFHNRTPLFFIPLIMSCFLLVGGFLFITLLSCRASPTHGSKSSCMCDDLYWVHMFCCTDKPSFCVHAFIYLFLYLSALWTVTIIYRCF